MKQRLYSQFKQHQLISGFCLLVLDAIFFNLTNPSKVPSALLIIGFGLAALTTYYIVRFLLAILTIYGLPLRDHGRRPAIFIGVVAAIMIALQSLGELTLRDVVVLILLSIITYLYMSYGRASRRG